MSKGRYLDEEISRDLGQKMVFIAGPRQVGKTTLAKKLAENVHSKKWLYLNWDSMADRRRILAAGWPTDAKLIVLDELHKYLRWKNYLKGEYDTQHEVRSFLVTGSARLNVYKKGGDSLLGRYHHYRLHPFSLAELCQLKSQIAPGKELCFSKENNNSILAGLLQKGGFPEPYFSANEKDIRRWQNDRKDLLFKEDIRDLSKVQDLGTMQLLVDMLPGKVGSQFSLNSLREDLQVSYKTTAHWLSIMESLYYCFRIYPYAAKTYRSLKKEPKIYLWDWAEVQDPGARLENMVAGHLLKFCHYYHDALGYKLELNYLRDVDKHEVDFLVTTDGRPWFVVEVKTSDCKASPHIRYFQDRLKIPYAYQAVLNTTEDITVGNTRVMPLGKFLSGLV